MELWLSLRWLTDWLGDSSSSSPLPPLQNYSYYHPWRSLSMNKMFYWIAIVFQWPFLNLWLIIASVHRLLWRWVPINYVFRCVQLLLIDCQVINGIATWHPARVAHPRWTRRESSASYLTWRHATVSNSLHRRRRPQSTLRYQGETDRSVVW